MEHENQVFDITHDEDYNVGVEKSVDHFSSAPTFFMAIEGLQRVLSIV